MKLCDLTLPSPEENLALDEALLELCESGAGDAVLRFWEPATHFVVVGYANRAAAEVNLPCCRAKHIPVLRRCTGGGTVVQGPGCLNYSLILGVAGSTSLQTISATNNFILHRHKTALAELLDQRVELEGHTDLAIGGRKFSGNSQRRRKNFLLFHGTFLLGLDLNVVEKMVRFPSKQPDYRAKRSHGDFLVNLGLPADKVKAALIETWEPTGRLAEVPFEQVDSLVREKYSREEWNFKF
jgi:lipoate-protein ligase A